MDTNKPIIICGSGNSIPFLNSQYFRTKCGLPLELQKIIKYNYSIGLNYWFKYGCETTFNCSGDWQFYIDNLQELKKLPMVIASQDPQLQNQNISRIHNNTILLKHSSKYYGQDSWKYGFYTRQLIGMFSLTLAIALGFKEIYLLGYDCKEINGQTHFYQGVVNLNTHSKVYIRGQLKDKRYKFRGIGQSTKGKYNTSTYNHPNLLNKKWYNPYLQEKKVKIYNVSLKSAIDIFPKISYNDLYKRFENFDIISQQEERKKLKNFVLRQLS